MLLGDDVRLLTPGWPDAVMDAFEGVAADTGLPLGFACVAFADNYFPGFPTFPVLHRTHGAVFGPAVLPPAFVNQDADPFLFQVRVCGGWGGGAARLRCGPGRWGCALARAGLRAHGGPPACEGC